MKLEQTKRDRYMGDKTSESLTVSLSTTNINTDFKLWVQAAVFKNV